ncbi:hypothetical protein [Sphingomonas sp.]|uniref:hypothetical protein n=1 Tax=Sphingomonas sp. TaxID=28214 RepID=UPI000DB5F185|nr:hypothetical protein [Sphingomonas sp.]PZU09812.1 MAG: hypothetical protein DI605_09300 [Sphingomonas sp.]
MAFARFLAARLEIAMEYSALIADHETIDRLTQHLLKLVRSGNSRPETAAQVLDMLAMAIRDHLATADPIIHATAAAANGARHEPAARASVAELDMLREDWAQYLYRWDAPRIMANWDDFSEETSVVLRRVSDSVNRETAVLYSLAVHYDVIQAG